MGYSQQDSHEFLIFLLDNLHDALNKITNTPRYIEIDDSIAKTPDEAAKLWWDNYVSRNKSIITELFSGQLHNIIKCDGCGNISHNYDPFLGLSLPLQGNCNCDNLIDCFNLFTHEEHLTGLDEVYCRKCKSHKSCKKSCEIYRAPTILIIQLKRFSQSVYRRDKLNISIEIPKIDLDLTPYMASIK